MANETIQVKYLGETEIRFYAIDASFVGIIKPGDIFTVSKVIFDADLANDPRYELQGFDIRSKSKSKKIESEVA